MSAPRPCERSKKLLNVPTTDARSVSGAAPNASSSNAGYSSDIPRPNTTVPVSKPAVLRHDAMIPIPAVVEAKAMSAAVRPPSLSGSRAPITRTASTNPP